MYLLLTTLILLFLKMALIMLKVLLPEVCATTLFMLRILGNQNVLI
jgi:hypothetical protein